MTPILSRLAAILPPHALLTGDDAAPWARDWTGTYGGPPLAVARPATTAEAAQILRAAQDTATPVVPASGLTGLVGGTAAQGALVLSTDRMTAIRGINAADRTATVEAGVILSSLHDAAAAQDLLFPMTFGARGSARIGGMLSTNAGGSNVLRYGSMRALCLGLEVVLPNGRVMDLMSRLHKDNSGLDLRDLMIGAEGTLGLITAAVLRLVPAPRAYATAMVALPDLSGALDLLHRLQDATGGLVHACEFMPRRFIDWHLALTQGAREPFADPHPVNILIELAATAPRDCTPGPDGTVPLTALLEAELTACLEAGRIADAVIATSEAQRSEMWARREAAAELAFHRKPLVDTDIALPLDRVAPFLDEMPRRLAALDPGAEDLSVAHLGDGNIHYTAYPSRDDPALSAAILQSIEDLVASSGGSFSAEHGVGLSKRATMARRKDPVALDAMRAIKGALDPAGIMNPGKVYPEG